MQPLRIWTAEESRHVDAETVHRGTRWAWLVEAAGSRVADRLLGFRPQNVLIIAGPGGNGADGWVAARRLAASGVGVTLVAPLGVRFFGARRWRQAALGTGVKLLEPAGIPETLEGFDWVIDAGFGTGSRLPLPRVMAEWLQAVRGKRIVAVDLPSGVDADTGSFDDATPHAEVTVTFGALKPAHVVGAAAGLMGHVFVEDVGLAPRSGSQWALDSLEWLAQLPMRHRDAHKYTAGRMAVVAGSPRYHGAAGLSGLAGLRAGAGYVEVFTAQATSDASTWWPLVIHRIDWTPEEGLTLQEGEAAVLKKAAAIVVGPGLGSPAARAVETVLSAGRPTVVDADGLQGWVVLGRPRWPDAIFTPHVGEAARLLDCSPAEVEADRGRAVRALSDLTGATVVLKGPRTLIKGPGSPIYVNQSGGPELATAGTGDVLSGMLGALLAQGLEGLDAARRGAYWHGWAGELAAQRFGYVTAVDVIDSLGVAHSRMQSKTWPKRWPVSKGDRE